MSCLIERAHQLLHSAPRSAHRPHVVGLLETGDEALFARICLIREAKRRIDLQTFIWANDECGCFIARELVQAAKRGVEIRLLVDGWVVLGGPELLGTLGTVHDRLTLKHFNPPAKMLMPSAIDLVGAALADFSGINQRMHSKSLIIDEEAVILGGRNYQNDYYDRGEERIFRDREVVCVGPAVGDAARSFELFWSSPLAVVSNELIDVDHSSISPEEAEQTAVSFSTVIFDELEQKFQDDAVCSDFSDRILNVVADAEFVGDVPGTKPEEPNRSCDELIHFFSEVKERLLINSPYFVLDPLHFDSLQRLRAVKPELRILVLTNSLASTDNVLAYAHSYRERVRYLAELRLEIFELKPHPGDVAELIEFRRPGEPDAIKALQRPTICGHAKTIIRDHSAVWIGSSNVDPRSARLNTENALIVRDPAFTSKVSGMVERELRPVNSWTVGLSQEAPAFSALRELFVGQDTEGKEPLSTLLRYPENFEPLDDTLLPFFDPHFHNHYRSVGPFPLVEGSVREMEVRLISLLPDGTRTYV